MGRRALPDDQSCAAPFDYSTRTLASLPRHSVSVAGVVVRADGAVLAIRRRDNDHWQPPGGVLESAETFEHGVVREVREETGADVAVERLTGVYKNVAAGIVAVTFRCRPLTEPAADTREAAEVAWLSRDEVRRLMTPTFQVRVLDAFAPFPAVRAHDGTHLLS